MRKMFWSKALLLIGVALLISLLVGIIYFYNFVEYSPYQSLGGAKIDSIFSCILVLPPATICLLVSWVLRKKKN